MLTNLICHEKKIPSSNTTIVRTNLAGPGYEEMSYFPCIGDIANLFINPIYDVHITRIYNLEVFFFAIFQVLGHF